MLDQLRRDLQRHLDELLDEANKLRQALRALNPHGQSPPAATRGRAAATRSRRTTATGRRSARATQTAEPSANNAATSSPRTASGETKRAVLQALAGGTAMTAGEVAKATGLGRASVSTTLSKLAKAGEVTKAARGYELAN